MKVIGKYLIRILFFLSLISALLFIHFQDLKNFFFTNQTLNSVILIVIAAGIIYVLKQIINIKNELNWLNESNGINGTLTDNKANVNRTDEYSWIDKKSIREELKGAVSDWWKSLGSDVVPPENTPENGNTNE